MTIKIASRSSNLAIAQVEEFIKTFSIKEFELVQKNPNNDKTIKIRSSKALLDTVKNDIEIFNSSIEISNNNGDDLVIKSGLSVPYFLMTLCTLIL